MGLGQGPGKTRYTADLKRPGMLYGRALRSPHAHARMVNIDLGGNAYARVHAVLTHRDVPAVRIDADLLPSMRSCVLWVMRWPVAAESEPPRRMPCA